jgi:hypothetical protein
MVTKKKTKKKRKLNSWQLHVQKTRKANKGMGFGDVLKTAKKTYKK